MKKVSVCITVLNEATNIELLINSVLSQTKVPNEVIIVDAGSSDGTIRKIRAYKNLKLIIARGANIAKGRNIAVRNAKNSIVVMTDAGCICDRNWIVEITRPFENPETQIVAGFYVMTGKTAFQIALKPFLGVMPEIFNKHFFLPSTRSIAFRKTVWKQVEGFNEKFDRAGEDTDFNRKLVRGRFKMVRVKKAVVSWAVPNNLSASMKKFFYYARGDVQSGYYFMPHNMKVATVFARYILFISLLFLSFIDNHFLKMFFIIFGMYLIWAINKHRKFVKSWKASAYTAIIQIASDSAVMAGFISGTWDILNK